MSSWPKIFMALGMSLCFLGSQAWAQAPSDPAGGEEDGAQSPAQAAPREAAPPEGARGAAAPGAAPGAAAPGAAPGAAKPDDATGDRPAARVEPAREPAREPVRAARAEARPRAAHPAAKPPVKDAETALSKTVAKLIWLSQHVQPEVRLFLKYTYGQGTSATGAANVRYNDFRATRGYLGLKVKPAKWFEGRITTDTKQEDSGDYKMRLKYIYGKFTLPKETVVVSDPYVMAGMISTPWISFEEGLNPYRMQGTVFTERNKLFGSADLGVSAGVLLGRKLPKGYQETVSNKEPGTWGSLAIGAFNGGGYSAIEKNRNKVLQARASIRPLGFIFPNLQLSYFLIYGKGNQETAIPNWLNHVMAASFEHRYLNLVGQLVLGKGNAAGGGSGWIDANGRPESFKGASGFAELKLPWIWSSLIARYDWFDGPNPSTASSYHRLIGGYAFHFWGRNKNVLLLDLDYSILEGVKDQWGVSLTLQIAL